MRVNFLHIYPFVGQSAHLTTIGVQLSVGGHEALPLT
jgi:hypothetical protein